MHIDDALVSMIQRVVHLSYIRPKGQPEGDEYLGGAWSSDLCLLVIDVTPEGRCAHVHRQNETLLFETVPPGPHCRRDCPSVPQTGPTSAMVSSYWCYLQSEWTVWPYTLSALGELSCWSWNSTFGPRLPLIRVHYQFYLFRVNTLIQFSPQTEPKYTLCENHTGVRLLCGSKCPQLYWKSVSTLLGLAEGWDTGPSQELS